MIKEKKIGISEVQFVREAKSRRISCIDIQELTLQKKEKGGRLF